MSKQFLPFLTDDQGRSLTVENEVVVTRSLPDPLDNSPEGWENNAIQWTRNNEFRAIIIAYTTSLKFFLHGAKILRDAFYRKGMETVLFFIWLKQNRTFDAGMKYEGWYKGEPDFGTFKDEYDGVSINIAEGGFFKDLQANKAVMQEIPFDQDAVSLELHAMNINEKLNYSDIEDLEVSYGLYGDKFWGPYTLLNRDGAAYGFQVESEFIEAISGVLSFDEYKKSTNIIIRNVSSIPITVTITGTIEFTCTIANTGRSLRFRYLRSNQDLADQNDYQIISAGSMVLGTTYSEDFSIDVPLDPGEALLRQGIFFGGADTQVAVRFTANSKSSITFVTRKPATIINCYRMFDLGNKLTGKLSAGATLTSPGLLEPDYNLLVTSGDAIRGIAGAVVKTTFSDWYKSADAVKCVAMDIVENTPVLSSRYDKFNKNSTIAALGECRNWTLESADDYIYDGVEVGYPAKSSDSNDDVNGKYSFNNGFLWQLNVTRRKAITYQAKSVYLADPWDITLVQLNFEGRTTTTSNTDNNNFFIDAEKVYPNYTGTIAITSGPSIIIIDITGLDLQYLTRFKITSGLNNSVFTVIYAYEFGGQTIIEVVEPVTTETLTSTIDFLHYRLRRPTFTTITGIPDDGTVFNLLLTPRRILENHLRWLRSSFDHLDGYKLVLKTTEKNKDLETIDTSGNVVNERADIPVTSMGEKVFLPYYTNFEIKSPDNLLGIMTANNNGKFDYAMKGIPMDGFPVDIKTQDVHLETQTYRLLMTANNDNTRLINNR